MIESHAENGAVRRMGKPRLIVLDDNPGWGNFVSEVAKKVGYFASYTTSQVEYIGTAEIDPPDVLVLDLFMPEKDGIEIIMEMAHWEDKPLIILMSGQSKALLTSAVRLGRSKGLEVVGSLEKPFRLAELRTVLEETAGLVRNKKKLGIAVVATKVAKTPKASLRTAAIDSDSRRPTDAGSPDTEVRGKMPTVLPGSRPSESKSLQILRDQLFASDATDSLRWSIAAINIRFCLALWQTHLAALTALTDVPGRLAEAAAGLIASGYDTEEAKRWREALRIDMGTLASNQALIREIAVSLRLAEDRRSAIDAIDGMSASICELQVLKASKCASDARLLELYRDICSENNRLKQGLAALLAALREAVNRGRYASGSDGSSSPRHPDSPGAGAGRTERPRAMANRAVSNE